MLRPKAQSTYQQNEEFLTASYPEVKSLALGSDHWVRMVDLDNLEAQYSGRISGEYSGKELSDIGKQLYAELHSNYQVRMPFEFLLIKNVVMKEMLVTVVDVVNGIDIGHMQNEKIKEISSLINELYGQISQYYLNKLVKGGFFLTDICGPSQYVFGHLPALKQTSPEDFLYLVDADLYLDNRRASLPLSVYWLARHLSWIEYRLEAKIVKTRATIARFLDAYKQLDTTPSEKNRLCLSETQKFLNDQSFGEQILPAIPTFDGA